jgi:hypothetical protein
MSGGLYLIAHERAFSVTESYDLISTYVPLAILGALDATRTVRGEVWTAKNRGLAIREGWGHPACSPFVRPWSRRSPFPAAEPSTR